MADQKKLEMAKGKEETATTYQEKLAQAKYDKAMEYEKLPDEKKHLGVRITVEFTGHLPKNRIEMFLQKLHGVVVAEVDNGGGGM